MSSRGSACNPCATQALHAAPRNGGPQRILQPSIPCLGAIAQPPSSSPPVSYSTSRCVAPGPGRAWEPLEETELGEERPLPPPQPPPLWLARYTASSCEGAVCRGRAARLSTREDAWRAVRQLGWGQPAASTQQAELRGTACSPAQRGAEQRIPSDRTLLAVSSAEGKR